MRLVAAGRVAWEDLAPSGGSPLLPLDAPSRYRFLAWLPHVLVVARAAIFASSSWHILLTEHGIPNGWSAALGMLPALALVLCLLRPMSGWWLSLAMVAATALAAATAQPQNGPLWASPSLSVHLAVLALVAFRVRARVAAELWVLTVTVAIALAIVLPGRRSSPT